MTKSNISLIKQAVVAAQSNRRQATSHTKTRGEVSGGGRKPWKQKGTGNARAGSRRSPIWVGGGITFGPRKEHNFKTQLPKKMARLALSQLFQLFKDNQQLTIVDSLSLKNPKTKEVLALLKTHNLSADKKVLILTNTLEPELVLASRNLKNVTVLENKSANILALSQAENVLMDAAAAESRGLAPKKPTVSQKEAQ